jgi:biotin carboxylase
VKEQALFINFHPYASFTRHGRLLLPTSEVDIHLLTRQRRWYGVQGIDPKDFKRVTVLDAQYVEQWQAAWDWALDTHPITRVIAVHEKALLFAAQLRDTHNLAGTSSDVTERFRDKVKMKQAVAAAGAAQVPRFLPVDSLDDLRTVDWTSGRWVIKSRWGLGASEVHVVDTYEDARQVCEQLNLDSGQYEIEEFITGDIYHCDAVVQDGVVQFANVGRYTANPASYRPGSSFGTATVLKGDLYERIRALSSRVLKALGLEEGVTHLELFHTPDDALVFCEVACRPPGGIIPPVIEWQFGINMVELSIRQQAGLPYDLKGANNGSPSGACGFVAFYPEEGADRHLAPELQRAMGVVEHIHSGSAGNGNGGVRHSTDFLDSYVVRAPDEVTLRQRLEDIEYEYRNSVR